MKFEQELVLNSVPEWRDHYLNYEQLKRLIYIIEQGDEAARRTSISGALEAGELPSAPHHQHHQGPLLDAAASEPLLLTRRSSIAAAEAAAAAAQTQKDFETQIEKEVKHVVGFFDQKKEELLESWHSVRDDVDRETSAKPRGTSLTEFWFHPAQSAKREILSLKLEAQYVSLNDLWHYADMNETGFRKILKKHDKVTSCSIQDRIMPDVRAQLGPRRAALVPELEAMRQMYAAVACRGDAEAARVRLDGQLKDQIQFERQAVWKDMVEDRRRLGNARVVDKHSRAEGPKTATHWLSLAVALALLVAIPAATQIFEGDPAGPAKRSCLAILLAAALLWCMEAIPLYVTSMAVPLLVVLLRALQGDDGHRLTPPEAMKRVYSVIFSQTIMLLLGGLSMSSALTKHLIAKRLAIMVLQQVGRRPGVVLLAAMGIALFASMWISNVAAPTLCYSIVQPILRTLSPDDPFSKALVMGIALASNVGGMTSPIASPQNVFAIERMAIGGSPPSWLAWFSVSMPVSISCLLLIWQTLMVVYPINMVTQEVRPLRQIDDKFGWLHYGIIGICFLTMGLWCSNTWAAQYLGGMGITALIPMVFLFGSGIITTHEFETFPWNVVMLAMGGIVLGDAATCSGLLASMAELLASLVGSLPLWLVLFTFCIVIAVVTSFISHTVGAMVMLPIVQNVGREIAKASGHDHSLLLVMGCALMCSGGMALPVSGFPNMTACALEDPAGRKYVGLGDFLKTGVAGTAIAFVCVVCIGYPLMLLAGM